MKVFYIIFWFLFATSTAYAQKHFNNWYFGDSAGVTFNTASGEPEALLDGQIFTLEGCSSISDSSGNLLFYTDGVTVWNRLHKVMKNGTGLFGHFSSMQSALIVPKPKSNGIYYIFTNDAWENNFAKGLNYSLVDMTLENGSGDVTQKNVHLLDNKCESVTAISQKNGDTVWILSMYIENQCFAAYLLTENGLNITPIITQFETGEMLFYGLLKFSPLGNKVAAINSKEEILLFDFSISSGKIKNKIIIKPHLLATLINGGLEFSDNGTFLYFTSRGSEGNIRYVHQVDISSNNAEDIIQSEKLIFQIDEKQLFGNLQIGPNKKIYLAVLGKNLSVIHNPNLSGSACNFEYDGCKLNGKISMAGLPSVVQNSILEIDKQDSIIVCEKDSVFLYSPYYENAEYEWSGPNGFISSANNPVLPISNLSMSGEYKYIISKNGSSISSGSIIVVINPRENILFSDLTEIVYCNDSLELKAVEKPEKCEITWVGIDSKENTVIIRKSGIYTVYVKNEFGCIDSASVYVYKFGSNISIYEKSHNFGLVKAGQIAEFKFTIENNESSDITVKDIFIKNEPVHFELLHNTLPFVIKSKEKTEIKVNFIPKYDINISDSIVIIFSEPCNFTDFTTLSGRGKGEIIVDFWLPDTTAGIGTDNYLLPVNVRLRDSSNYSFKTNITARIKFLRTLYNVNNLTYGQYSVEKLKDSAAFNIEFNDVIISDELNNISDFAGKILFTNDGFTKVRIESLEFSTPYLIPIAKDGSIKTNEICNPDLKGIKIREGTFLSLKYDNNQGNSAIAYCGSAGEYKFSIYSIAGELLYSTNWNTDLKTEKHFVLSDIITNSGLYFVVLNSVDGIDLQKVTVIK